MFFAILFILLTVLSGVAVFGMWFLGAIVESRTYKSYYYEDLPEDFVRDKDGKLTEIPEKKGKIKLEVIKDNMGIESLCKIRNLEDKSIINPLIGGGYSNAPIIYEFEEKAFIPEIL